MRWINRLGIKSKIITMLLVVSGCSILLTAYSGYRNGKSNLTNRVFYQLTSVRASKAYQIEFYFQTIRNHIETLSQMPSVITAMQDFTGAYNQLANVELPQSANLQLNQYYQKEFLPRLTQTGQGTPVKEAFVPQSKISVYLQHYYIAANPHPVGKKDALILAKNNSNYSRIHQRYHPIFQNIIKKFGYYDLFLIDPQGNIVYTVYKETDFATNLNTGAYNDSNLARLIRDIKRAKDKDYARIIDFEAYSPSYGAPAAFIAVPLFKESRLLGFLALQLPVDEINKVMTGNRQWVQNGLGNTGETYLVGQDYLMRSISRFLLENPEEYLETLRNLGVNPLTIQRIRQYQTSILQQKVQTIAVERALAGQTGTQILHDYRNIPVLSSYAPLQIEGLNWVILAEIDLAEAYAPINNLGQQLLIWATLLMLLVTLLAMFLAGLFVKPIEQLSVMSRQIKEGQLNALIPLETDDELGELSRAFKAMVDSLRDQIELSEQKNRENEELLLRILPDNIIKRLKRGEKNIADSIANVAVLYSDLTGFSSLTESLNAQEMVDLLNDIITSFDEAAELHGMEKIKTIGDSYMAVCGLSVPYLDPGRRALDLAIDMQAIVRRFNHQKGLVLNVGIGIDTGDIVAGLVGTKKFIYDVWGDAINRASELKETCSPGDILVSKTVYSRWQDIYEFEMLTLSCENGRKSKQAWRLKSIRQHY